MTNTHTGKVFDRLAVQIVSKVADRVDNSGELGAYEGIEAAREIRELMIEAHAALVRRIDTLEKALGGLLSYVERNTCQHDETHRGGVLWEICDQCGAKWADDVGGRPKFKWHADVTNARAALHPSDNEVKK